MFAPMCDDSSDGGKVTDQQMRYMKPRTAHVGIADTSYAYVNDSGIQLPGQLSAAHDSDVPGLSRLATTMKIGGAKAILQLSHAGRGAGGSVAKVERVYAPSKLPFPWLNYDVDEMSKEDIQQVINDYREATKRAIAAGFDGLRFTIVTTTSSNNSSLPVPTTELMNTVVAVKSGWHCRLRFYGQLRRRLLLLVTQTLLLVGGLVHKKSTVISLAMMWTICSPKPMKRPRSVLTTLTFHWTCQLTILIAYGQATILRWMGPTLASNLITGLRFATGYRSSSVAMFWPLMTLWLQLPMRTGGIRWSGNADGSWLRSEDCGWSGWWNH